MKPLSSRTLLCFFLPRNPSSLRHAPLFLQVCHFSTQSSNFHSQPSPSHYSSRRHDDESRNVRVSVWWDFENCHIPVGVNVFRVAQTITAAIRTNGMKGPIQITAFGDVQQLSRANQEALSSTGINLTHIPNGGKNSADRSLLVDLLYWVSRNPPPAHLFLISGDRDFAGILHRLRMNNYNILLASPEKSPSVLCSAASIMWHWTSMIKGEELIGKHYNQPPDGPHGSWYGYYKAPLEDPFATPEQPPPPVKNEDTLSLEPSSELKVRPVPRAVVKGIYNVLREHPEGIPISIFREELRRGNVLLDKDLFGHKRISQLLSSMPHIIKLEHRQDGQYLVQLAATARPPEPSLSSSLESGEMDQKTSPNAKVASEDKRSSFNNEQAKTESQTFGEDSSEKAKQQASSVQNGGKLSHAIQELYSSPEKEALARVDSESNEEDLSSVVQLDSKSQVGFFRRIWRRWLGDADNEDPNKECESRDTSVDHKGERRGKEEVAKMVTKDVDQVNSESSSLLSKELSIKDDASEDSEKKGLFRCIMSWCKLQGTTSEPEQVIDQSNEEPIEKKSDELAKDTIFSQESLWSEVKSFLDSPRGSNAVSQSRTREALGKNMKKSGPAVLGTLNDTDLLHLIDLLISEKKLIKEDTSQVFPFRLSQPRCQGSKELRSIFSNNKPSEEEGEKKAHTGISPLINKKPTEKSRNEILADFQKLVQELLVQYPHGYKVGCFRKDFLKKYGYPLNLTKLGYQKVTALLHVIPGISLESGVMVPSGRVQLAQSHGTVTKESSDGDSSDSWDELGPVTEESSGGKTKPVEYEPATLLDEEEDVMSGSDDGGGRRDGKQKSQDEDSSLMQILDSWYSKEPGRGNRRAVKAEEASTSSFEMSDQRHRNKKTVYSFVADADGGEGGAREKQIEGILCSLKKRTSEQQSMQQA